MALLMLGNTSFNKFQFMNNTNNNTPQEGNAAFIAAAGALPSAPAPIDFKQFIVDFTQEAPKPDFLLEIDGVGVMPSGGITTVTGKAKQGKTQFLAAVVACLLSGKPFGSMKRREAPAGPILWVDTEQSSYNIHNTLGRVFRLAGIPRGEDSRKHGLTVMQVRALNAFQRREVIREAVQSIQPSLLIIDGLRDLLTDYNSIEESALVLEWINAALVTNPGMRIAVVMHTNPNGGDKIRGTLGTELENKLNDKFLCTKENATFSVTHTCRDREILNPFCFCIDEHGDLATSTIEASAGAVDADAAFVQAVPEGGAPFAEIKKNYAKLAGMTQAEAAKALKARMSANPPTLMKDAARGVFYRPSTNQAMQGGVPWEG